MTTESVICHLFQCIFGSKKTINQFSTKFAGQFFDPLRVVKNFRLPIYLKLVNLLYCMASSVRVILGDPAAASRQDAICSAEGYCRAKVYFKSERARGKLPFPNQP